MYCAQKYEMDDDMDEVMENVPTAGIEKKGLSLANSLSHVSVLFVLCFLYILHQSFYMVNFCIAKSLWATILEIIIWVVEESTMK